MYAAEVDFTDKELIKKFLKQYKKYISKNMHPKNDTVFRAGNHKFHLLFYYNYSHWIFADDEVDMMRLLIRGVLDAYDVDDLMDAHASFAVFGNYLFIQDGPKIYINGVVIDNPVKENGFSDIDFISYHDYLILDFKHIANFEHIDNIIKPTKEKLCKNIYMNDINKKFDIDINNLDHEDGNVKLYRGVPIVFFDQYKIDRYLIAILDDNNVFASLRLSI